MLKPEQLDKIPDRMVELYAQVEADIIADMCRRISTYDYYIPAAQWQYKKLMEMGKMQEYIMQELSSQLYISWDYLEEIFAQAGIKTIEFDDHIYEKAGLNARTLKDSPALIRILNEGLEKTHGLFRNLTGTTAAAGSHQFEMALDKAYMQIITGAFDTNTAVRNAIKDLASKGLASITYPNGYTNYIETAVRRAVITGVNQTALRLQETRAEEMGCDLVEVSAHAGARNIGTGPKNHASWQGKIYSLSGTHKTYPDFKTETGYGTGEGLGGWNCRHSFFPFFEGLSEPGYSERELEKMDAKDYEYNGKKMTEYEATQRQRYIERNIRRGKREYAGMNAAGLPTDEAAANIAYWQDIQSDFLKQTGLKRQVDREQMPGFGKSEARKVNNKG